MSKIIETNNTAKIIHKFIEDGNVPRHGISYFEALEKCAQDVEAEILASIPPKPIPRYHVGDILSEFGVEADEIDHCIEKIFSLEAMGKWE